MVKEGARHFRASTPRFMRSKRWEPFQNGTSLSGTSGCALRFSRDAESRNPRNAHTSPACLAGSSLGLRSASSGVRLTCAELYADCVIVRWQRLVSADELAEDPHSATRVSGAEEVDHRWGAVFELRDDLGTLYAAADPGSEITGSREAGVKGEPNPVWGRSVFVPAAPPKANRLTALRGRDEFKLNLG